MCVCVCESVIFHHLNTFTYIWVSFYLCVLIKDGVKSEKMPKNSERNRYQPAARGHGKYPDKKKHSGWASKVTREQQRGGKRDVRLYLPEQPKTSGSISIPADMLYCKRFHQAHLESVWIHQLYLYLSLSFPNFLFCALSHLFLCVHPLLPPPFFFLAGSTVDNVSIEPLTFSPMLMHQVTQGSMSTWQP